MPRGRLARDWDEATERMQTDEFGRTFYEASDRTVVERVGEVARERGAPRAQVALAWMLSKPMITAPIVGATKLEHLEDAAAAVSLELSEAEIALLEEPYRPHAVAGIV